ncbi:sensor domain-containing diguanylate cyclase [Massilia sp. KIM]|uniref:GGDEF domain-containing protein n=1 Tax=Massilia sp. KIM TaxID=1955422 RepID=UPI001E5FBF8D|nr:sensor domain-containing diguanylate cyclase [Massilia sp. KIM]
MLPASGTPPTDMAPSPHPDPHISRLAAKKRPAVRYAIAFLAVFCALLVVIAAWDAWSARRARLADTVASTSNVALALAAQGESTIRVVDTVLAGLVERIDHDGLDRIDLARLERHLRDTVAEVKELHGLFVYGADGSWIATSLERRMQHNNSDRAYFHYHRTHKDRKVHVGLPVRSRSSGVWILPVSRRLDNPDGSFAGVVLGTIRVDYFSELYERFDTGRSGTIVLLHDSGVLIYRHPFNPLQVGNDVTKGPIMEMYRRHGPVGSAMMRSYFDKVERQYSYRHLDGFPLIVSTAQSKQDILAPWWQSTLTLGAVIVVVLVLLVGFGSRLVRQIMIRDRLEEELTSARAALQEDNRELARMADHDGMTGIANRRRFEEALAQERSRAMRTAQPLSLVMLDVDFFKKFNDTYGHVAGDDCLRRVATAIGDSLARPSDLAARYGGEEFVVLLPATHARGAQRVAERIREAVMAAAIPHAGNPAGIVTISAGVSSMRFTPGEDADPTLLVERADALLYRAKQAGRNQVCGEAEAQPAHASSAGS